MLTTMTAPVARGTARPSMEERLAAGRLRREAVPLDAQAAMPSGSERRPLQLLEEQARNRVPELRPIRIGRMAASPFAFYRGAARVMAADLAEVPWSGLGVQMCGDAHLVNFGLFGSPERRLMFDANDFDETLPGPFEHDVKRLAASVELAARAKEMGRRARRALVVAAVQHYREAMADFAAARRLEVWYSRLDAETMNEELAPRLDPKQRRRLGKALRRARTRDSMQAFRRLTEVVDGRPRIRADAPLLVPVRDLLPAEQAEDFTSAFDRLIAGYRDSLQPDRRALLEQYEFVDMARKVVGVGSVGTRCWVVLLVGRDAEDPLLLQVKEAEPSVHAEYVGASEYTNQGERVVAGQRLMQQSSDIFLGWLRTAGVDGVERDFYVRQLHDWKGALDVEHVRPEGLRIYGEYCAWCLARAHARSGDPAAITGYLGSSAGFEHAIADFAAAYADLTEADHRLLADAVADGRVEARADT